jgi:recombination protein RecT
MSTTTNTSGIIAAATQNKPAENKPKTPSQLLNSLLNGTAIQQTLKNTLKENSGSFVTSVMNLFNEDKLLQQCEPKAVLGEALKAAALKLPVEKQLGFAYIIPFKDHGVPKPQFQLGYKGYIQLAMRTGEYKHINADVVYEGELKSVDRLTGAIDLSGEKVSDTIIGYFAYIETVNGFSKTFYWSKEKVIAHAKRYSKSYKPGSGVWGSNFDEMAIKTVLRNLLSHYGVMSVEMSRAISSESISENYDNTDSNPEIIIEGTVVEDEITVSSEPETPVVDVQSDVSDDYPFANE